MEIGVRHHEVEVVGALGGLDMMLPASTVIRRTGVESSSLPPRLRTDATRPGTNALVPPRGKNTPHSRSR